MAPNFYVDVPPLRKRKPPPSPSPSGSSRASSPNPSPSKRARGDKAVDVATSGLYKITLGSSILRPGSPTVSDLAGPTIYSDGRDEDASMPLDDEPESSVTAAEDVLFQFDDQTAYVAEDRLPRLLKETPGEGTPIRCLRDFTLFKCDGWQLINATELLDSDSVSDGLYGASGRVGFVSDDSGSDGSDDEDAESSFGRIVKLLTIVGFNVHDFDRDEEELDEKIYIQTEDAWYILESPSPIYSLYWTSLWVRHRFAHLVLLSSLNDLDTTYDQFLESLDGRETSELLTESAFKTDDVIAYIFGAVEKAIKSSKMPIRDVPLIKSFTGLPRLSAPKQTSKRTADNDTHLSPMIGRIVKKHLLSPVSVVGTDYEKANATIANELHDILEHHDDPKSMRWRKIHGQDEYSGVEMDGVIYRIGDIVAVKPGHDENTDRAHGERFAAEHCVNKFANNVWFIRIIYFFNHPSETERDKPKKMLHGQWFIHGSRTILQETTHSQELFLLNECDDIAVATIFQRCDVRFLDVDEVEYNEPDKPDPEIRNYFCRFAYDPKSYDFVDLPSIEERDRLCSFLPSGVQCPSCGHEAEQELFKTVRVVDDGLALYGRTYHVDDYVYVKPNSPKKEGLCFFIGRILEINLNDTESDTDSGLEPLQIKIRHYERHPEDPRQIYRTGRTNCVFATDLEDICFVRHLDPDVPTQRDEIEFWVNSHADHFYTNAKETEEGLEPIREFQFCEDCFHRHCNELEQARLLPLRVGKIPVLEVFSGAGGLSQGLDQCGLFRTEWAVERSFPAAETFRLNHPETKVLCTDINDLLRYSVDLREGKPLSTLRSSDKDRTPIPDKFVPQPGQPGLVCGGPPCQSFSGANSHKREDDPRSALPFTMLSVAEVYEPNFFLLENVVGLLQHSVTHQAGNGRRIEKAMLKLILRGLLALNYQARVKILQAGQHGSPQDRERVIFFGAKRECKLPEFPIPTHAFHKPAKSYQSSVKNHPIRPVKRGRGDDDHIFAPHASVTIEDATGDLPAFDWINPHKIKAETPADVAERKNRIAQGVRQFDASKAPVGFTDPVPYATPPTTRYQQAMRRANEPTVKNHVTDQASPFVVEASATVPLKPYANHKSLPPEFFGPKVSATLKFDSIMCFGRLDGEGEFKTAMTTVKPRSRGSYVLHPTQKRPISVVEAKRGQGFPDNYLLWSDKATPTGQIKDFYRHIGNAVPVPLAAALGRSLEAAFVETWRRMGSSRESSPEL
ncbi:S-adenosyl-L-methionine-dependent methyltransferase [Mycena capillaripes]|nr:S-adenosyl-L-methionine-dependent methyltransferase [Mycena capillaripes]